MKKLLSAFTQALESIRANFFHTFLSILGIVIGVAALVAILSLIDGMEKFAKAQISETTNLRDIMIRTESYKTVNKIRIKKDTFAYLNYETLVALQKPLQNKAVAYLFSQQNSEITANDDPKALGAQISGLAPAVPPQEEFMAGRNFTTDDLTNKATVAIANYELAEQLTKDKDYTKLLGQTIHYNDLNLKIIGILKEGKSPIPTLVVPFTLIPETILQNSPPTGLVEANSVEDVPALKTKIKDWLAEHYPTGNDDFSIVTNDFRVDQVSKGFLLFRIIMGMIVGISVLVGGIGVMNVLLISVTERTPEIGLRKAMGANRRDIMRLFLSESITISLLGSLLGLLLGILGTMIAVPIIKFFTKAPFHAAYTLNTLLIITVIAILIGILFGTYPAMKAARLDPVEAIRRE